MPNHRKHIQIRGVVQGVGFRPLVYNLAHSLGLSGYVFNSSSGVTIEIEGDGAAVATFLKTLKEDPPPLAEITEITVSAMAVAGGAGSSGFSILGSREEAGEFALVSPDAGTCDACWSDFGDPANRRYGYPFTNCTQCGPRYTILRDIPYDRAKTTMSAFLMCADCEKEYEDPRDRRFHAQPNACAVCGPSLLLVQSLPAGSLAPASMTQATSFQDKDSLAMVRRARGLLAEGRILAVKGLGGFLLACDATHEPAVAELRRRKRRPHKPFALMVRDLAAAKKLCHVTTEDEASLLSPRRPIVILPRRADARLAPGIAPGDTTLGVMLPYTPLHYLLFSDSPHIGSEWSALVMTSGNLSEEPIMISNHEAVLALGGVADWFLLHNRDIATRVDDSVVRSFEGRERLLRRSRGFVPQTIDMGMELEEVLAFGGELKNTFCLTKGRYAILSQHIGDLENYETMQFFEETLANLQTYVQSRAARCGLRSASGLYEYTHGSGLGHRAQNRDTASSRAYRELHGGKPSPRTCSRSGHGWHRIRDRRHHLGRRISDCRFRRIHAPGTSAGCAAARRGCGGTATMAHGAELPARCLWPAHTRRSLRVFRRVDEKQVALVDTMLERRIQTVETSSCGRLFDAVAALLGLATR